MDPSNNPNVSPQVNNPNQNTGNNPLPEVYQPATNPGMEQEPNRQQTTPEMSGPAAYEVDNSTRETANQNQGMPLPPVIADPAAVMSVPQVAAPTQVVDDSSNSASPATADDVDVVEKEWVDRARRIVEETKNDPRRQEQEVEKLQMDYLKKRYGKDLKSADV